MSLIVTSVVSIAICRFVDVKTTGSWTVGKTTHDVDDDS